MPPASHADSHDAEAAPPPFAELRGTVLFTRHGSFSRSNENLLAAFAKLAPDLHVEIVDTRRLLTTWRIVPLLVRLFFERGPRVFLSKRALKYHVVRSVAFWNGVRRLVTRRARRLSPLFTLQTQTLFDAALPGTPHAIYTDFAARGSKWSDWNQDLRPHPRWLALEYPLYRRADRVFTFGTRVRDLVVEEYDAPPRQVVCAGAGPNIVTLPDHDRQRPYNILFVGLEWERKGGPDLVRAFEKLKTRLPEATLTIVGCSPAVRHSDIVVHGRQPPARTAAFFNEAACFCMPSRLEPFGIVYVEALHAGLPIVASDCGDQYDLVEEGRNGFVVGIGDVDKLAVRLYDVLVNPDVTRRMGEESLKRAPRFTWETTASIILDEMRGVVEHTATASTTSSATPSAPRLAR